MPGLNRHLVSLAANRHDLFDGNEASTQIGAGHLQRGDLIYSIRSIAWVERRTVRREREILLRITYVLRSTVHIRNRWSQCLSSEQYGT